jgi:hypothetical protein
MMMHRSRLLHLLPLFLVFAVTMATDDGISFFIFSPVFNEKNGNRSAKLKKCHSVEILVSSFFFLNCYQGFI